MVKLYECPEMKAIDARLELSVHDELIISCPTEHSKEAERLLAKHMIDAAEEKVHSFPFTVDTEVMERWGEVIREEVNE